MPRTTDKDEAAQILKEYKPKSPKKITRADGKTAYEIKGGNIAFLDDDIRDAGVLVYKGTNRKVSASVVDAWRERSSSNLSKAVYKPDIPKIVAESKAEQAKKGREGGWPSPDVEAERQQREWERSDDKPPEFTVTKTPGPQSSIGDVLRFLGEDGQLPPPQTIEQLLESLPEDQRGVAFGLPLLQPDPDKLPWQQDTLRQAYAAAMGSTVGKAASVVLSGVGMGALGLVTLGPIGGVVAGTAGIAMGVAAQWSRSESDFDNDSWWWKAMSHLDVPVHQIEKALGFAWQSGLSLSDPEEYGTFVELLKNREAAWEAGILIPEVVPMSHRVSLGVGLGAGFTAGPQRYLWGGIGGLMGAGLDLILGQEVIMDSDEVFVDYDLDPAVGGITPIIEARNKIAEISALDIPEEEQEELINLTLAEIEARFGLPGQMRELAFQFSPFDPLEHMMLGQRKVIQAAAKVKGNKLLAEVAAKNKGGWIDVTNQYRIQQRNLEPLRLGTEIGDELGAAEKLLLGSDLQIAREGKFEAKLHHKLFGLTPGSRARELVNSTHDHLSATLSSVELDEAFPHVTHQMIKRMTNAPTKLQGDFPEAGNLANTVYGRVVQRVLENGALAKVETLLGNWDYHKPFAELVDDIAVKLDVDREIVMERVIKGEANAVLAQYSNKLSQRGEQIKEIQRLGDQTGLLKPVEVNAKTLTENVKAFKQEGVPYTLDMYRSALYSAVADGAAEWGISLFGVKPYGFGTQLAATTKALESLILLTPNPAYYMNNLLNGLVTLPARGIHSFRNLFMGKKALVNKMSEYGAVPARMTAGIGQAGLPDAFGGNAGLDKAVSNALNIIGKAEQPQGGLPTKVLHKAQKGIQTVAEKVPTFMNMGKAAQTTEQWQSAYAVMTGFEEMWSQVHRLGVGVDHMPPSLSEALGDTAVNAIYQAVLDGKNPAEIGRAILNEPQKISPTRFYEAIDKQRGFEPGTARRILIRDGLEDRLQEEFEELGTDFTATDFTRAVARVKAEVSANVDQRFLDDLEAQAGYQATILQAEGAGGLLKLVGDVDSGRAITYDLHFKNLNESWADINNATTPEIKTIMIQSMFLQADDLWKRQNQRELTLYNTLENSVNELGLKPDTAPQLLRNVELKHKADADFHQLKQKLYGEYFAKDKGEGDWENDVIAPIDEAYDVLMKKHQKYTERINKYLVATVKKATNNKAYADALANAQRNMLQFNTDDQMRVKAFWESIREGVSDQTHAEFHAERIKLRTKAIERHDRDLAQVFATSQADVKAADITSTAKTATQEEQIQALEMRQPELTTAEATAQVKGDQAGKLQTDGSYVPEKIDPNPEPAKSVTQPKWNYGDDAPDAIRTTSLNDVDVSSQKDFDDLVAVGNEIDLIDIVARRIVEQPQHFDELGKAPNEMLRKVIANTDMDKAARDKQDRAAFDDKFDDKDMTMYQIAREAGIDEADIARWYLEHIQERIDDGEIKTSWFDDFDDEGNPLEVMANEIAYQNYRRDKRIAIEISTYDIWRPLDYGVVADLPPALRDAYTEYIQASKKLEIMRQKPEYLAGMEDAKLKFAEFSDDVVSAKADLVRAKEAFSVKATKVWDGESELVIGDVVKWFDKEIAVLVDIGKYADNRNLVWLVDQAWITRTTVDKTKPYGLTDAELGGIQSLYKGGAKHPDFDATKLPDGTDDLGADLAKALEQGGMEAVNKIIDPELKAARDIVSNDKEINDATNEMAKEVVDTDDPAWGSYDRQALINHHHNREWFIEQDDAHWVTGVEDLFKQNAYHFPRAEGKKRIEKWQSMLKTQYDELVTVQVLRTAQDEPMIAIHVEGMTKKQKDLIVKLMERIGFEPEASIYLQTKAGSKDSFDTYRLKVLDPILPHQMSMSEFERVRPEMPEYEYHGSPAGNIEYIDPQRTKTRREGQGAYTTVSREAAETYARGASQKGATKGKGRVNYVRTTAQNILDFEAPLDPIWDVMHKEGDFVDLGFTEKPSDMFKTNGEAYYEIQSTGEDVGYASWEVNQTMGDALLARGFDATSYTGRKGQPSEHTVTVHLTADKFFNNPQLGHPTAEVVPWQTVWAENIKSAIARDEFIPDHVMKEWSEFTNPTPSVEAIRSWRTRADVQEQLRATLADRPAPEIDDPQATTFTGTDGQVEAVMTLLDARARSAVSRREVADVDEWYRYRFAGVTKDPPTTGDVVLQGTEKGAVTFLEDGRALLHMMSQADVSTAVHEIGHVFRRELEGDGFLRNSILEEDLAIAAEWSGATFVSQDPILGPKYDWSVEAEEKFARGFEKYLSEGKAPNSSLEIVFEQLKRWLRNIYKSIVNSPLEDELSPAMRDLFDRLLNDYPDLAGVTGNSVKGWGADPTKQYDLKWRIVEGKDIIASHEPPESVLTTMKRNPKYAQEYQPRQRERQASTDQVLNISKKLSADELLKDTNSILEGSPIITPEGQILSGNVRYLAWLFGVKQYPAGVESANAKKYTAELNKLFSGDVSAYGITDYEPGMFELPMLVRVLNNRKLIPDFVREANVSTVQVMSRVETAVADAGRISDESLRKLHIHDTGNMDATFRSPKNKDFVRSFMEGIPETERAALFDATGMKLTSDAINRLTAAVFAKAIPGETGVRLANSIFETNELGVKNITTAVVRQAGNIADIEALARTNIIRPDLVIAEDIGKSVLKLQEIKESSNTNVENYLKQSSLFGDELNAFQKELLTDFNNHARSEKKVRTILKHYYELVKKEPSPQQTQMLEIPNNSKPALWERAKDLMKQELDPPPASQDVLFQRGEVKNLYASHNLSVERVDQAMALGGFPSPSIAIHKSELGHTGFGNVTVIFKKDVVDPQKGAWVYERDAYSKRGAMPAYPRVKMKDYDALTARMRPAYEAIGRKYWDEGGGFQENLIGNIDEGGLWNVNKEQAISKALEMDTIRYMYMMETNKLPEAISLERMNSLEEGDQIISYYVKVQDGKTSPLTSNDKLEVLNYYKTKGWIDRGFFDAMEKGSQIKFKDAVYRKHYEVIKDPAELHKKAVEHPNPFFTGGQYMSPDIVIKDVANKYGVENDIEKARALLWQGWLDGLNTQTFDVSTNAVTYSVADNPIFAGSLERGRIKYGTPDYINYVRETIGSMFGPPRIKVQGEWQPYTLNNVVLAKGLPKPGREIEGMSEGKLRALSARRFTSVHQIRKYSDQLKPSDIVQEYIGGESKRLSDRMMEFSRAHIENQPGGGGSFHDIELIYEIIANFNQVVIGKRTASLAVSDIDAQRKLMTSMLRRNDFGVVEPGGEKTVLYSVLEDTPWGKREGHYGKQRISKKKSEVYTYRLSEKDVDRAIEFAKLIRETPARYFEAIPHRAVRFDEVAAMVVPHDTPQTTIDGLKRRGIEIKTYNANDKASRIKAVRSTYSKPDVLFQVAGEKNTNATHQLDPIKMGQQVADDPDRFQTIKFADGREAIILGKLSPKPDDDIVQIVRPIAESILVRFVDEPEPRTIKLSGDELVREYSRSGAGAEGQPFAMKEVQLTGDLVPGTIDRMGYQPVPYGNAMEEMQYQTMPLLDDMVNMAQTKNGVMDTVNSGNFIRSLEPAEAKQFADWLRKQQGNMAESKLLSMKWGEYKRDAALLNYGRRYNQNHYLGLVAPYEFWLTTSMRKWAIHSIDRPKWLAAYYRINKFLHTQVQQPDFPDRLAGRVKIPLPFLPDWMGGGMWVNPGDIGLPFGRFLWPFEARQRSEEQTTMKANRQLYDMLEDGKITQTEFDTAMEGRSGQVYDRAVENAQAEDSNLRFDAFDWSTMTASPHVPLMWAYQYLRGTPERIGPLPMTRQLKAISALLGIGGPGGVNIEENLRRKFDLPIYDQWDDYRIDRALSDMAAEGLISVNEAKIAMIEKRGDIYLQGVQRSAEQVGAGTLNAFIFGSSGQLYPEGERRQRVLKKLMSAAWAAQEGGDTEAISRFFDAYPEYEARLALFDDKDERLMNFLVTNVWNKWYELPRLYQNQVKDQLGDTFSNSFIKKPEDGSKRDYSVIPLETLAMWAKAIGTYIPDVPELEDIGKIPIEYAPYEMAVLYDQYSAERAALLEAYGVEGANVHEQWDNWRLLNDEFHKLKEAKDTSPEQVEIDKLIEKDVPNFADLEEDYYRIPAVNQKRAVKDLLWPNADVLWEQYFDIPKDSRITISETPPASLDPAYNEYYAEQTQLFPDIGTVYDAYYDMQSVKEFYAIRDAKWSNYGADMGEYGVLKNNAISWRQENWPNAAAMEIEYYTLKNSGASKEQLRNYRSTHAELMSYWSEKNKDDSPHTIAKDFREEKGLIEVWNFTEEWDRTHPDKVAYEADHPEMQQHRDWKAKWGGRNAELMAFLQEHPRRRRSERSLYYEKNLKELGDWDDAFDEKHPEIQKFLDDNPKLEEAWEIERDWQDANPMKVQTLKAASDASDEFLESNPVLNALWDNKRKWLEEYPELEQYVETTPVEEIAETVDELFTHNPALSRMWVIGLMGGGLSDATIRALRGEWELSESTEPFEIWLAEKSDGAMLQMAGSMPEQEVAVTN